MNRIGIVCALHSEARCFISGKLPAQQPVELNENALLILSGMGRERARQAAQKLAEAGADCLAGFGAAGALAPTLRPGDLVLAEEVWEGRKKYGADAELRASLMKLLSRNNKWLSRDHRDHNRRPKFFERISGGCPISLLGVLQLCWVSCNTVHGGALACAGEPIAGAGAKRELFARSGALAVDMESAGVFDAAQRNGLPALALRVIVDAAHVTLPGAVLWRVDDFGDVNTRGLALDLARSPGQIPAVMRLACAARRAGRTMRQVATLLRHSGESLSRHDKGDAGMREGTRE